MMKANALANKISIFACEGVLFFLLNYAPIEDIFQHFYLPNNIFLMSLSLFKASTGVRLLTSKPSISSRI